MRSQLMSSAVDHWETPGWLFQKLDSIFHFELDAAASDANHKCPIYLTQEIDGLHQDWSSYTQARSSTAIRRVAFCNPPYGSTILLPWFKKFVIESRNGWTIVALIAARTETQWHKLAWDYADNFIFLYGRLKFELNGQVVQSATFPSELVVFNSRDFDLSTLSHIGKVLSNRVA